jgi:alpha-L-arabinofuranosidase
MGDAFVSVADDASAGYWNPAGLAGDSAEAYNDVERPNRVVPKKTQLTFKKGMVMLSQLPFSWNSVGIRRVLAECRYCGK